jgi:hypothetical protein
MYRTILCAAACAAIFTMPAKADETVKWRHVLHTASLQTLQVGDVPGHALAITRLAGVVFFSDGSMGATQVFSTTDGVNGSGVANGYQVISFNGDGSELWFKYTGTIKVDGAKNPRMGTFVITGGKGRYAEAKGDGTWSGGLSQPGTDAAAFYIDVVANIKK